MLRALPPNPNGIPRQILPLFNWYLVCCCFKCLCDVLSTLALVKCLIVWLYVYNVSSNDCMYRIESALWKSCSLALLTFRHPWVYDKLIVKEAILWNSLNITFVILSLMLIFQKSPAAESSMIRASYIAPIQKSLTVCFTLTGLENKKIFLLFINAI